MAIRIVRSRLRLRCPGPSVNLALPLFLVPQKKEAKRTLW